MSSDILGPNHSETIVSKHNLAELYHASDRSSEAEELQRQILELLESQNPSVDNDKVKEAKAYNSTVQGIDST